MGNICAGIVLYNPDIERLKENIYGIYDQVDLIILVDNNSENIEDVQKEVCKHENIKLIKNEINLGIASALNQIMEFGEKNNFNWVLTLDQDSICPKNLIAEYNKYIDINDVAIICPKIIDINRPIKEDECIVDYKFIDKCITSASLTNVEIWKKISGFDEKMFIDMVDFDYCRRVTLNNFKILRVNNVSILHEIGNITQHKILGLSFIAHNHSSFRKYYIARNIIYFERKHKLHKTKLIEYLRILKLMLISILFEKNKIEKIKMILKGTIDGYKVSLN